ncbi:MAG: type 4a pilus biogenesis protein PilO [Syntrophales bacterium]
MKLDLEEIKKMSPRKKGLLAALVFLLAGYLYYSLLYQPLSEKKSSLQAKLSQIRQQISGKELIIKEIQKNKKEVLALKESLQTALTKLPDQKEIPGLLSSLSEEGRKAGMDFLLFEPVQPVSKEFYAEIPVKVTVNGGFHDVVRFFEQVAKLPRIVNITDFSISAAKDAKGDSNILTTSCMIKTYMFVEKAAEKKDEKKK